MDHKGITITFNESGGFFSATDKNGKWVEAQSLAGIKKKLDAADTFTAFDALRETTYREKGDYVKCRVTGIQKPRGKPSPYNKAKWIIDKDEERSDVYADTPENLAALRLRDKAQERHREEMIALRSQQSAEMVVLNAAIQELSPS